MKRVALLPEGSVSEEAALHLFGSEPFTFVHFKQMTEIYMASVTGLADYSIIPIENTIDGSVLPHTDLLIYEAEIPIQAEWDYPSVQNLVGFAGTGGAGDVSHIRKIVSIPVAIAQCHNFLKQYLPNVEIEHVGSTAEGVVTVRNLNDPSVAAIGTMRAAKLNGLVGLAQNITDHHNNFTRFVLVGREPFSLQERTPAQMKTSILVTLPEDFPGALHQVLSAFAWRKINLSKIESRPTKKKLGSYYFYIDMEGSLDSVLVPAALQEIEALGCQVRILGSYPCYHYECTNLEV